MCRLALICLVADVPFATLGACFGSVCKEESVKFDISPYCEVFVLSKVEKGIYKIYEKNVELAIRFILRFYN